MAEWIISSSVLILVVIVLRAALKGRISLRLQYGLWALVLLRLLVPISFGSSNLSVMNVVEHPKTNTAPVAVENANRETVELPAPKPNGNLAVTPQKTQPPVNTIQPSQTKSVEKPVDITIILLIIWGVGAAAVLACFVATNFHFARNAKRSRRALPVEYCKLPVYVTDWIETPCLIGLFRPAIYLTPEATVNKTVLWHTIEHGQTHYRHKDHIWSFLRGVCLVLHWYHPLVWWAAVLSRKDAELACDEATIRRIGEEERAEYGRTLIGLSCRKRPELLLTATTMTGSKSSIKERIVLIAKKPKTAVYTLIAVIAITAIVVGITFTGAKDKPEAARPKEDYAVVQLERKYTPWGWAQEVTADELDLTDYGIEPPQFKQSLVGYLNALEKSDFTYSTTKLQHRTITELRFTVGTPYAYKLFLSNDSDCMTLEFRGEYWDINSPELREFMLNFYQEKLHSRGVSLPWVWAKDVTADQLKWLNDDADKQFVVEQLHKLDESDFSEVDTLSRESMGIWVDNGDNDSYSLCPSDTMDCVTLVVGGQYWDFNNPELRGFILDTYQEMLDSKKFIQPEPQRSVISERMDDLLSSGDPSITLYLKDNGEYGPVAVDEWHTQYLTSDLDNYTWIEMEKTPEEQCDYQVVVTSNDGTKRVTFRPDGVWGAVEYNDGNTTTYWRASASADTESVAKLMRRSYDFSETGKPITFYVDGSAEEAAEYFAEHAFGEYMLSFAPGGVFTNIEYYTISWEVTAVSEDDKSVTGFVYYAFMTEDGEFHGGGNATKGSGEHEGMYTASQSFSLRKEDDGYWLCCGRGTG